MSVLRRGIKSVLLNDPMSRSNRRLAEPHRVGVRAVWALGRRSLTVPAKPRTQ
jgi:hypothetical protein